MKKVNLVKSIKAIVLDGSGTLIDAGVYAPAFVFQEIFRMKGLPISMEEARKPMGNHKKVHIQKILEDPQVNMRWAFKFGVKPTPLDTDQLFEQFIPLQLKVLKKYGVPISGALDVCRELKNENIKLGFSTGFTREMVDTILELNPEMKDILNTTIAADEVPIARPAPFMVYKNMMDMGVIDPLEVIKVDDTEMGVKEGFYTGCWSVGITRYSNLMAMTEDQVNLFEYSEPYRYHEKSREISNKLYNAGANYVIETMAELPNLVKEINEQISLGKTPHYY